MVDVPALIAENLYGFFLDLTDAVDDVWDAITSLPERILEGIKSVFVPDDGYIDEAFNDFLTEMKMKFGIDTGFFEDLFFDEAVVDDVNVDYTIPNVGNFNLKVFDSSFLVTGVTYFRPFIRGFLVLMLFLFHVKQLIGFFGYDAGVVQGRSDWIGYNKANTGGHKE